MFGAIYVLSVNLFGVYLIVQARNRFKRDSNIIDIVELGVKLYGPWVRPILITVLVLCNFSFLMAYTMHFGYQTDLIVCRTFKARECGHKHEYSIAIVAALLPIVCLRELNNIGYFTAVILIFSLVAVIIIIIVTS